MSCGRWFSPFLAMLVLLFLSEHSRAQNNGCSDGDVRLQGANSTQEGRVEFCFNNEWGTVCNDNWDDNDARVVCRQLGFSDAGARAIQGPISGVYEAGTGQIYLDEVRCVGTERMLVDCIASGVGTHNCDHNEDAGVKCEDLGFSCEDGEVRLVGGPSPYAGRVEVCLNNKFSTVCDDGSWTAEEATVVCRQLNASDGGVPIPVVGGTFGLGIGDINFSGLQCTGAESNLTTCPVVTSIFSLFCSHFDDAGVLCPQPNPICENGDIRLVNGRIPSEGRIEICYNGMWGTICHDGWENVEARVACGELGYPGNDSYAIGYSDFGRGEGLIHLSNFACDGSEDRLFDCGASPIGQHFCHHGEDAGLICQDANNTCTAGDMRLVGGETPNEGRLEVCFVNHWGTVCDDDFDALEASLVCRELGFPEEGAIGLHAAFFGQGVGVIFVDDVECTGNETSILNCSHLGIGRSNCFHNEDVSVLCQGTNSSCTNGEIRLADGSGSHAGRVEVCFNGRWGTVCDDTFGADDASVVCRQLGFPKKGAIALGGAFYGEGTGPIYLDDIQCLPDNHTNLLECFESVDAANIGEHNCQHSEDVSVICAAGNQSCGEDPNGAIRLVGGSNFYEGRVEICLDGEWGTICDTFWTDLDAVVACRQLSLGLSDATARTGAFYGQGNGSIHLDRFFCSGVEERITDCIHAPATDDACSHSRDAGVTCSGIQCSDGDVRLVDGQIPTEGRVEICFDNQFQTVCDDFWDARDATVVCRQLGYSDQNAIALPSAFFGPGSRNIALDDVRCFGNESRLLDCPHLRDPTFCFHFEDAGVLCEPINSSCSNGDLRLVGGSAPWEGNVEVCFSSRWGSVCHDRWGKVDAEVTCRLLGFGNGSLSLPTRSGYFGFQDGPIYADEVGCIGNETNFLQCVSVDIGDHNCNHRLDAGVICAVSNSSFDCEHGDIRLVGGQNEYEGRVEVCINGVWGTVCDDRWDTREAQVVCRQLGLGDVAEAEAFRRAFYGRGEGDVFLTNMNCRGDETDLLRCVGNVPPRGGSCGHNEDAGVRCPIPTTQPPPECVDGDLRLFGGAVDTEGTIEVCQSGEWTGATICDDLWDSSEAAVVCRQLGYQSTGAIAVRGAFFGQGEGDILYSNFGCRGNESRLSECSYSSFFFCFHSEDAGVICPPETPLNCTTGDVRLRGGTNEYEGRVEVCLHGHWGTVCDDQWDSKDATVVCRQLNYTGNGGAAAVRNARFGAGDGFILLDDVRCEGNESRLLDCRAEETGIHNCQRTEDAGVFCPSHTLACTNGEVRLVDGEADNQGRVELCLGGQWGTVCGDSFWGNQEAQVICRQLGYETPADAVSIVVSGGSGPIHLSQMSCQGSESKLIECTPPDVFFSFLTCTHATDAGVVCDTGNPVCTNGDVRLVNGATENVGRLEICFNGLWGTVCDDQFDRNEAKVVCRQLNYTMYEQSAAIGGAFFGQGTTAIHLDELRCTGSETRLSDCPHGGVGTHNCGHNEDVGVICVVDDATCDYGQLRLVGGASNMEGRVEICVGGIWGTICDDNYDRADARVICRQLGFSDLGAFATDISTFGQGTGAILLDDLQCIGNETRLIDCPSTEVGIHNCLHFEDIGVRCDVVVGSCNDTSVRLINGQTETEGTVELCRNGAWGTVCDDFWDNREAEVVCRQLGFQTEGALAVRGSFFSPGLGDILVSDVGCRGNESRLTDCVASTTPFCTHREDAGVLCPPTMPLNCTTGAVRLVDGTNQYEGRVEVCLHGRWGTVCDDQWDSRDATVVCRQLGYNTVVGGRAFGLRSNTIFPRGSGLILLDEVDCSGNETTLFGCRASELGQHNCASFEDSGVLCPYEGSPCVSGQTRLNNNGTINNVSGTVEVCVGGRWSTVCVGNAFDDIEAEVLCRQLGYTNPTNAISAISTSFAFDPRPVLVREPSCTGTEEHIFDCGLSDFPDFFCDLHLSDAAVFCLVPTTDCEDGEIRLVDGASPNEGRVEICFNNLWGTICDDLWGFEEAEVVCRQLGYTDRLEDSIPFSQGYFGVGLAAIHLDDVSCNGTEERLADCAHSGVGNHNCLHQEDAGVLCIANSPVCDHGALRLVGGDSDNEGRVEICVGGRWGTICNDDWDRRDARVVCRQLGFPAQGAIATDAVVTYGIGIGPIFLDDLRCLGNESEILSCPSSGLGRHNCGHSEDVAVVCNKTVTPSPFCVDGDLRLFGGETENEGTLELCLNQAWGTICDDLWDNNDAQVACRTLGFQTEGAVAVRGAFFGRGEDPIHVSNLGCLGNESRLTDCPSNKRPFCFHFEDAGVICPSSVPYNCSVGDVRLRGGSNEYEGRVEVCIHGRWGTVCDDNWDNRDADVVCRQLGYTSNGAPFAVSGAAFGSGNGFIVLDEVRCAGNESRLFQCRASEVGAHNCLPSEDAGVFCPYSVSPCRNGDVRLADGSNRFEGRVEICVGGRWGTVCQDSFWNDADAQVICRQIGYESPQEALATTARDYGFGTGPIFLNGLNCSGRESRVTDCPTLSPGFLRFCTHSQDTAVICRASNITICTEGDIRLVDGDAPHEGRVEVCAQNQWGTVCDDQWDARDAIVVCRQLRYSNGENAVPVPRGFFGAGVGRIHLDDLGCDGTEETLFNCSHRGIGINNCIHSEDAGVICQVPNPMCQHGDLRLVGGSSQYEGRVEICLGGTWGTVCDDGWDPIDASVVCRQLNYSPNGATSTGTAFFGQGEGPIFLDDTACTGNETRLIDCGSSGIGAHNCLHFEDAGVVCQPIPCTENSLRLSGGLNDYNGRVEVCVGGIWGEVCASGFEGEAAAAVCQSLGVEATPTTNTIISRAQLFDQAEENLKTYNVMATCDNDVCTVTNTTENAKCMDTNKVGLFCRSEVAFVNQTFVCADGDLRLAGSGVSSEGRVEVCLNNQWGTVCDDSWDEQGAGVVCRQLGYSFEDSVPVLTGVRYGPGTGPILLDDVKCTGDESNILSCPQLPLSVFHDCTHSEDIGVRCTSNAPCQDNSVRLVNGGVPGQGRIEICYNNQWGTICNDELDEVAAEVICRQLNFNNGQGAVVTPRGFFGSGTGQQMSAGTLNCQRSDPSVDQCSKTGIGNGTCEQSEVAGVICRASNFVSECEHGSVRLMGGSTSLDGRVEVCLGGQWGSVCADTWSVEAANVACGQLGYQSTGAMATIVVRGDAPTLMSSTACNGDETSLLQCKSSGVGVKSCQRAMQAGVTCQRMCTEGTVRLTGGVSNFNGHVEVCSGGEWGGVCMENFGSSQAMAVCSSLGFDTTGIITTLGQIFQQSVDRMQATYSLTSSCNSTGCSFTPTSKQCSIESSTVGLFCPTSFTAPQTKVCSSGEIRLAGGTAAGGMPSEGRLEVCLKNTWGTVCDDSWDDKASAVACRQMGFQTQGAKTTGSSAYGSATGAIFLDDVKCTGEESNIFSCPQLPLASTHNCQHTEDVAIQCSQEPSTKGPEESSANTGNTAAIVVPLILIILLLILIIAVIIIIIIVYRARKTGKLTFRNFDDEVPITNDTSFTDPDNKDDIIPLEEKAEL